MRLFISWFLLLSTPLFSWLDMKEKPIVYVFMLEDCVICQSYTGSLKKLYNQNKEKIDFVLVFPNKRSKTQTIDSFIRRYDLKMSYITDYNKELAASLHASVTPEVIMQLPDGIVIYRGAIDDANVSIGKKRKARVHYLENAIKNYLKGEVPVPDSTRAVGCLINFKENQIP